MRVLTIRMVLDNDESVDYFGEKIAELLSMEMSYTEFFTCHISEVTTEDLEMLKERNDEFSDS